MAEDGFSPLGAEMPDRLHDIASQPASQPAWRCGVPGRGCSAIAVVLNDLAGEISQRGSCTVCGCFSVGLWRQCLRYQAREKHAKPGQHRPPFFPGSLVRIAFSAGFHGARAAACNAVAPSCGCPPPDGLWLVCLTFLRAYYVRALCSPMGRCSTAIL